MTDERDRLPTPEWSLRLIRETIAEHGPGHYVEALAMLHFAQARVIRGERARAEAAEASLRRCELSCFDTEQENERLKALVGEI